VTIGSPAARAPAPLASAAAAPHGASLDARLRAAFADDLPRRRAQLDAAVAAGDFEKAGLVLHGLRGSASHLAEPALEDLCARLEADAVARDLAHLRAGMAQLHAQLDGFTVKQDE